MSETSKTDWKRLAEMDDDTIDISDISELDDSFFKKAAFPEAELAKLAF